MRAVYRVLGQLIAVAVVLQVASNRVELDEFNRGAAPLSDSIARAVAGDLAVLLGTPDVGTAPMADFNPAYSPCINFPGELIHKGYVGICLADGNADEAACRRYFAAFSPGAERIDIALQRSAYGMATPPLKLHLEIVGPKP